MNKKQKNINEDTGCKASIGIKRDETKKKWNGETRFVPLKKRFYSLILIKLIDV